MRGGNGTGAADDPLTACLGFLFPHGAAARFAWFDRSAQLSWLALPRPRTPRILVPTAPARATGRAVVRTSAALDRPGHRLRRFVGVAATAGLGALYPGRIVLDRAGEGSIIEHLSDRFDQPVSVAISVGPARANLKPVLGVFSAGGEVLSFVKIGYPDAAARHVEHETAALRSLAEHEFDRLQVPRVLFTDTWRGAPLLATSVLAEPPHRVNDARERLPLAAMAELEDAFAEPPTPLSTLSGWQRLQSQAATASSTPEFADSVARITELHGDRHVRPVAWHGDWTPWNMSWGRDHVAVWDWERFERGVPAGLDALHYAVYGHVAASSLTAGVVQQSLAWARANAPARSPAHSPTPVQGPARGTVPATDGAGHEMTSQVYLALMIARHLAAAGPYAPVSATLVDTFQQVLSASLARATA